MRSAKQSAEQSAEYGVKKQQTTNYTTMDNNNDMSEQQDSCVVVKLSDVLRAMREETILMDVPAMLVANDTDSAVAAVNTKGAENSMDAEVFKKASMAFMTMLREVNNMDPKAWADMNYWWAKGMRAYVDGKIEARHQVVLGGMDFQG